MLLIFWRVRFFLQQLPSEVGGCKTKRLNSCYDIIDLLLCWLILELLLPRSLWLVFDIVLCKSSPSHFQSFNQNNRMVSSIYLTRLGKRVILMKAKRPQVQSRPTRYG